MSRLLPARAARASVSAAAVCAALLLLASAQAAAERDPDVVAMQKVLLQKAQEALGDDAVEHLLALVTDKASAAAGTSALATLIKDWNIEPKIFHAKDTETDGVLGFTFDYRQSVKNRVLREKTDSPLGVSLSAHAKGGIAADAKKNPDNLLEGGLSLHVFQGLGGLAPELAPGPDGQKALDDYIEARGKDPDFLKRKGGSHDALRAELRRHLRPQFTWDFQGHAALETNQQFTSRQWTYGGKLSLGFRDWRTSNLGWLNLPDYPFAALRWLFEGGPAVPSAQTFPVAVLGFDQVDPAKDEARLKIDPDKSRFDRDRAELAFKTPVLRWEGKWLHVHASWRHYREHGASKKIRDANLASSDYFVARLDLPSNFHVSYSTGRLPFDRKDDQVYAVGWSFKQ